MLCLQLQESSDSLSSVKCGRIQLFLTLYQCWKRLHVSSVASPCQTPLALPKAWPGVESPCTSANPRSEPLNPDPRTCIDPLTLR